MCCDRLWLNAHFCFGSISTFTNFLCHFSPLSIKTALWGCRWRVSLFWSGIILYVTWRIVIFQIRDISKSVFFFFESCFVPVWSCKFHVSNILNKLNSPSPSWKMTECRLCCQMLQEIVSHFFLQCWGCEEKKLTLFSIMFLLFVTFCLY